MFSKRTEWNLETNRFSAALERLRCEGKSLLDLTVSNPTTSGFKSDEGKILQSLAEGTALQYSPEPRGLRSAREAVRGYYATLPCAASVANEQIFLTTSTSEGYSYAFRLLCNPGEEVLVPRPGYPLFEFLATIQDVSLASYPLIYDHGWHLDWYSLESMINERTRAVVVVHPNNPTGSFVQPGERERLGELCAKHGLAIIADEVFLDYRFGPAVASFVDHQQCLTFTLSGLSKVCGLPQMKVAWMVVSGPAPAQKEAISRLEIIADTYLSLNTPVQAAMPELLNMRHRFQEQLNSRLRNNLDELDRRLQSSASCRRLEVVGGWYATLRVPATQSDEDLAISLMEKHGVIVHPGHFFDFPADGYLVVSLMTPEEDFREGIKRVLGITG
ncbi:MAG TPA: pyridoxal phosphate-dependent aminotransferase [Terriglobales bacterium]|nr:pyridoxal phosphate-dependent aminotransferase [Terriglobales bacterium]